MRKKLITALLALILTAVLPFGAFAQGNFFTALIVGAAKTAGNSGYDDALAMMIMSFDWDGSGARLLVLDRDEMFEGAPLGSAVKLSGEPGVLRAVNEMLGLDISKIVMIDMGNIPEFIRSIGGVKMTLDEDDAGALGVAAGEVDMDKDMTEAFLAINVTDDPASEANSRRNAVLEAVIQKAQSGNLSMSFDLAWTGLGMVSTNIDFFEVVSLGSSVLSGGIGKMARKNMPLTGDETQAELVKAFLYGE